MSQDRLVIDKYGVGHRIAADTPNDVVMRIKAGVLSEAPKQDQLPSVDITQYSPEELENTVMSKLASLAMGKGASTELLPVYKEILTRLGKLNAPEERKPKPDKQLLRRIQTDILNGKLLVD